MDASTLGKVESQRLQLEDNIAKLRKSLNYWQTLEIDYEGLKEEFSALPTDASRQDLLRASQESGSEILEEKELLSIIGGNGHQRTSTQIVDVLTKRIEYVSRNVSTIRKQISSSVKQRDALIPDEDLDQQDGAVAPLTEITEELDENNEVVSAKLETADSTKQYLVDLVNKAGAGGTLDKYDLNTAQDHPPPIEQVSEPPKSNSVRNLKMPSNNKSVSSEELSSNDEKIAAPLARDLRLDSEPPKTAPLLEEETVEVSNGKPGVTQNPDDTEEDAALRQEMLQYGLGEVGAIVAELDLEDFDSNEEDDADSLLAGSDFDEDEDESEDERGMTKNPIISESYRRRMQELEKKLGMQGMQNLGQKPTLPIEIQEQLDRPPAAEAARKAAIARANAIKPEKASNGENKALSGGKGNKKEKKKKKVAFADDLDIAPAKGPTVNDGVSRTKIPDQPIVPPMGELIVERPLSGASTKPAPASAPIAPTKRASRFKTAKTEPSETSVSPEALLAAHSVGKATETNPRLGKIVSDTLVERPSSKKHSFPQPPDPDDLDEELHRRQIAVDYHKMRNRLIQQQGGFIGDGELDNYGEADSPLPVEDEVTGDFKKVSRFKAARMK